MGSDIRNAEIHNQEVIDSKRNGPWTPTAELSELPMYLLLCFEHSILPLNLGDIAGLFQ